MESSSGSTPAPISTDPVAKRTQEWLIEMETRYKNARSLANLILIIGRTGTGKSSLLEDLTESSGHSQQSVDSVTQEFEIEKALIGHKEYYIMDTPGFDPENEQAIFLEIVRGIQTICPFARITGLLYLTCINQPRFDDFDRKLIRFIRVLCGDEYLPRITFVTTFWTAAGARQQAKFNQQLESLRRNWHDGFDGQQLSLYQHGQDYNADGLHTGCFVDWFENRDQVAQHGRDMIARCYGGPTALGHCIPSPKIVQELDTNTTINDTDAGKLLGLAPASPTTASSYGPSGDPGKWSAQRNSAPSSDSDHQPRRGGRQAAAQATTHSDSHPEPETRQNPPSSWTQIVGDIFGWLAHNVHFQVNHGGPGPGQAYTMGNAYKGPLDPRSSVDMMKSFGLDSSRDGRLRYAVDHGIGGVPFSAEWGNAIRRDVLRRHG